MIYLSMSLTYIKATPSLFFAFPVLLFPQVFILAGMIALHLNSLSLGFASASSVLPVAFRKTKSFSFCENFAVKLSISDSQTACLNFFTFFSQLLYQKRIVFPLDFKQLFLITKESGLFTHEEFLHACVGNILNFENTSEVV